MNTNVLAELLVPPDNDRVYGVVVGLVTNNKDPQGMGRVKVQLPWLSKTDESWWARVAAPMAGKDRGLYLLPEVGDEVLVAFEHGDVRRPNVLGCLWNGKDTPPESNRDGKNSKRTLKSRSGHVVRLDDSQGKEKIEIIDKSGKNSVVVNTADNSIAITAGGKITISAKGDVAIESSGGKLALSGATGVELTSKASATVDAATLDLKAKAQINAKAGMINLN